MQIQKKTLADAVKVLGKVCCVTSPVDVYRSIRIVGTGKDAVLMATDDTEVVSLMVEVDAEGT